MISTWVPLLKVGGVTDSRDVKTLRQLYDQVGYHIRSLKALGVESKSYGSLLCPVLLGRLPSELQLIVSRKVSEEDWKVDELMKKEIVARERVTSTRPANRRDDKPPPSATTLVSDPGRMTVKCCYCDKPHFSTECDVVTDIEARKQALRKGGRCFSCLRKGRNCRTTNRCRSCNGRLTDSSGRGLQSDEPNSREKSQSCPG